MLKSLLGIARQWSREKFAILTTKPRSHKNFNISNVGHCLCMRGMHHPEPSERLGWCCFELQYEIVLVCVAVVFVSFYPSRETTQDTPGGGGVLLGILGGGVPPGSLHPDPISDQKESFSVKSTRFQTWPR